MLGNATVSPGGDARIPNLIGMIALSLYQTGSATRS
jgi:hypothetical protein